MVQEPDVFGVRWEAANGKPGYADLCIKLMDVAYSIVPDALFLVEGTAQSGLAYNWGERRLALRAYTRMRQYEEKTGIACYVLISSDSCLTSQACIACKGLTTEMLYR